MYKVWRRCTSLNQAVEVILAFFVLGGLMLSRSLATSLCDVGGTDDDDARRLESFWLQEYLPGLH